MKQRTPSEWLAALIKASVLIYLLVVAAIFAFSPDRVSGQGTTTVVGGAGGSPGGANSQIQFNNNGAFGGNGNFTFDGVSTITLSSGGSGRINLGPGNGSASVIQFGQSGALLSASGSGSGVLTSTFGWSGPIYQTTTNCSSSASPAVCAAAPAGSVAIAAAATTETVNTTAVTANSQIILTRDDSLGTKLAVTCNTATVMGEMKVSARTSGTSFTITVQTAPATNPGCVSYSIVN